MEQVFWSREEPQAGVIAQSFRQAYLAAGTEAEQARVSGAADDWWRACGVVDAHGGQLTPIAVAAMAVRAGEVHNVEGLVVGGLVDSIGEAGADAATTAAEQGWGEWAAEKAQATKDAVVNAYTEAQKLPGQVKDELVNLADPEPEKVLWPIAVAVAAVAGALAYIIAGRR